MTSPTPNTSSLQQQQQQQQQQRQQQQQQQEDLKRKYNFSTNEDDDQIQRHNNKYIRMTPENTQLSNEVESVTQQNDQQISSTQSQPPQRKKPGRKPNPASPALRKAQNRAAQRAFRERKERHLRDLENTIKSLRETQYESLVKYQKDTQNWRLVCESQQNEISFWKELVLEYECALNSIHGSNEATSKIKASAFLNLPTARSFPQQILASGQNVSNPNQIYNLISSQTPAAAAVATNNQISFNPVENHHQVLNELEAAATLSTDHNLNASKNFLPSPTNSSTIMSPACSPLSTTIDLGSLSPPTTFTIGDEFGNHFTIQEIKSGIIPSTNQISSHQINNVAKSLQNNNGTPAAIDTTVVGGSNNDDTNISSTTINPQYLETSSVSGQTDYSELSLNYLPISYPPNFAIPQGKTLKQTTIVESDDQARIIQQLIGLAQLVRASNIFGVQPKVTYPLSPQQNYFLSQPHDPRIDMIPCLHLRARIIEHRDRLDLFQLCDLFIHQAKCHGDPMDPDAWELPEVFFEQYKFLTFTHCKVKSNWYRNNNGIFPSDLLKAGGSSALFLVS
ncbi:hypothetical protein G9A89_022578 [Geosiphon pyriformis]|nr:hypothetical protein G9A89_022578 [Geosiphon pyriformis]